MYLALDKDPDSREGPTVRRQIEAESIHGVIQRLPMTYADQLGTFCHA